MLTTGAASIRVHRFHRGGFVFLRFSCRCSLFIGAEKERLLNSFERQRTKWLLYIHGCRRFWRSLNLLNREKVHRFLICLPSTKQTNGRVYREVFFQSSLHTFLPITLLIIPFICLFFTVP
ncbi:hypothetical protein BT93_L2810 [Corymbia citriodora subsp. variegata]|uniref:Uncharacterized protein n=1 Tax=Corymbia citriodora subsp. variegata TaxID=360336 RepID=A0A8T0CIS1_CORYI|nr:hypothetical protein BT93_L2810 [Corymbia citriodora subsp. variegata]